jgi:hypothetical protein
MPLVEKLGSFYLGKEYDTDLGQVTDRPVNYDSRDLTTHAVCVGMTGSGKTGLCIGLLEEAAIDGVPALIVDPKGDITNLLLTFPDLRPEDFLPWINVEEAEAKGVTPETYAASVAETWAKGLAEWDQGPERIRLLRETTDLVIYTPGSEAGLTLSILSSFKAPALDWDTEAEALREQIQGIVSALLGLVGIAADPLRSREHILLSNIIETSWRAGQDLDIGSLILAVQKPPFAKMGVFDVDAFFPEKDRFGLAMLLNNIIASPSFASWTAGHPLDIGSLLWDETGKPRHSIFYLAHLNDAERMFFVTLLVGQLVGWMRTQSGTTSLRALFYMDEIFGFFPPVNEPPSKRPLLTLLKQGRAFGLGVVLAAQNPIDLDYKGLSNAGTWFVGKLQTERDKARLMEGLSGALAAVSGASDSKALDQLISSLRGRTFLLHDVHAPAPLVFETRWALSYLCGPLTRKQIKQLMADRKAPPPAPAVTLPASVPAAGTAGVASSTARASDGTGETPAGTPAAASIQPPDLAAGIRQVYLPLTLTSEQASAAVDEHAGPGIIAAGQHLAYEPALLGLATVRFVDRKFALDESRDLANLVLLSEEGSVIDWKDGWSAALTERELLTDPEPGANSYAGLPPAFAGLRNLSSLGAGLADYLYRSQVYILLNNPSLKLHAELREIERDFRARCQQAARELRDAAVDKLAAKYDPQFSRLQARLDRTQANLDDARAEYGESHRDEVVSSVKHAAGALGLFGRKKPQVDRAASRRADAAKAEIGQDEAEISRLQADMAELQSRMQSEASALSQQWLQAAEDIQEMRIVPRKSDVNVRSMMLAWAANWQITYQDASGQTRTEGVPAYTLG